jgi:hypothetical protein
MIRISGVENNIYNEIVQTDPDGHVFQGVGLRGSLAGIAGSNPAGGAELSLVSCVLPEWGLCDGPIPRPEES